MKKLFNYVFVPLLSLAGIGTAVAINSTKENKEFTKLTHALPEGLVDTYDVVTLSDISYNAQSTYAAGADWTNPTDYGFFHKSSTNTTGSVVFKYKQHVTSYPKSGKSINTVLRGTNYYNDGFEFYHTDNDWRSVQIRVKNESNKQIAEWWGGASGDVFKDDVTHDIEIGAIDYTSGNKTYCYYMLDGVVIASADYENTNNYDFNHPFATVRASSSIPATLTDSDEHRLVANFSGNSWTDSGFLFLNVNEMANYAAISTNGFSQWGHFVPSSGATLQYQHAGGNNQNLTALAFPFNNAMGINLAYNGLSSDYVENDRLVISGLFRQETSSTNHINAVFSVPETRLIYSKGMWRAEAEYQAALVKAQAVDAKIDAIGEVDFDSESAINEARAAYNALSDYEKQLTTKYSTLEAAEARLQELKAAKAAAEHVDNQIDSIGVVTLQCEALINTCRNDYEALTADGKAFVTKLDVLEAAEARLAELKAAKATADEVDAKIEAIGEVSLSSETAITEARAAYEELNDEAQGFVTKLNVLQAAEAELARLKGLKAEAQAVDAKIEAIPNIMRNNYESDKHLVTEAREAYDALSEEAKGFVEKLYLLQGAEGRVRDIEAAIAVDDLIVAIGEVTLEKEQQIVAARTAYNALTANQNRFVQALGVLEAAEARLQELKDAKTAAEAVDAKIEAIGTVSLSSETAINEARSAYDALSEEAKGMVTKLATLEAAETELARLKGLKEEAEAVDAKIDAIGEITLSSEDAIAEARTAYEALNEEAKGMVTKLTTLQAAETRLQELKDAKAAAEAVDAKINAIGEVALSSEAAINEARAAYDALSTDAKEFVTKLSVLEAAEARLAELKANKAAAEAVDAKIEAIGEVTVANAATYNKIGEAYQAYMQLSEEAKSMVTKTGQLQNAMTTYFGLLDEAVEAGLAEIDAIHDEIDMKKYSKENQDLIEQYTAAAKEILQSDDVVCIEDIDELIDAYVELLSEIPVKKAPAKKGCGGSVIATSVVLSALALAGISLLSIKKRKED